MKKLAIVAVLSLLGFSLVSPTVAAKAQFDSKVDLAQSSSYVRRAVILRGTVKEIRGTKAPTEVVMTVNSVTPKKGTNWQGAYPVVGKNLTLKVTTSTKTLLSNGKTAGNIGTLTSGDKIYVTGMTNEDSSVSATTLRDDSLQAVKSYTGTIESINTSNNTFMINSGGTTYTVKISQDYTRITTPSNSKAAFGDLRKGDQVSVSGIRNTTSNMLVAALVRVTMQAK